MPKLKPYQRILIAQLSLLPLALNAESLFEQQVRQAAPDSRAVRESEQQVRDHQGIKIRDDLAVPPFHKRGQNSLTQQNSNSYCTSCHLPLPHQKQLRSRAFLNMHVAYVACETCHLRPEDTPLDYRWLSYDGGQSPVDQARFYAGTALQKKSTGSSRHEPQAAAEPPPSPPRSSVLKIAPFYKGQPALVFKDSPFAQSIRTQWKAAEQDYATRGQLRARLHAPLETTGPDCTDCHTDRDGLLDFAALGATPEQQRILEHNTIADFFAHYKTQPNQDKPDSAKQDEERIRITDLLK